MQEHEGHSWATEGLSKGGSHVDGPMLHLTKQRSNLPRHRCLPCPSKLTALQTGKTLSA